MMRNAVKHIITAFLVILALNVAGQSRLIMNGQKAFKNNNFVEAVEYFKKALPEARDSFTPNQLQQLVFKIGASYLAMNRYEEALPWLSEAVSTGSFNSEYHLTYADALTLTEQKEQAIKTYRDVLQKEPYNTYAEYRVVSLKHTRENPLVLAKVVPQNKINSSQSDYAPAWFKDKLVFSSARPGKRKSKNPRTGQYYADLYQASYNQKSGVWEGAAGLSDAINGKRAEGSFVYDPNSRTAYFTRCYENKKPCRLMKARLEKGGTWIAPEALDFGGSFSTGHPALSDDGKTLYFVSDREGGYGQKDVWKIRKLGEEEWSVPVNLGPEVNSSYDELFPHLAFDSLLFFASDRPESAGGLDIFVSQRNGDSFEKPRRLSFPFNSLRDDFAMIVDGENGLFSSNRNNEKGSDDLFAFEGLPLLVEVRGRVLSEKTKQPVGHASAEISSASGNISPAVDSVGFYRYSVPLYKDYQLKLSAEGFAPLVAKMRWENGDLIANDTVVTHIHYLRKAEATARIEGKVIKRADEIPMTGELIRLYREKELLDTTRTDGRGNYSFSGLEAAATYEVKISKEGYFSESRKIHIPLLKDPATFSSKHGYDMDFQLTQIQKKKEVVINNIFYDFNKASLRPESKQELDRVASMLRETPNVIIQINAHTDKRGSRQYNRKLSQKRAQSVVDYIAAQGIDSERLFAKGFGESRPLIEGATSEAEHQLNRRTSFKVLAVLEAKSSKTPELKVRAEELEKVEPGQLDNELSYRVQILALSERVDRKRFNKLLKSIPDAELFVNRSGDIFKYEIGQRASYDEATELRSRIVSLGQNDCFITAYHEGERIAVKRARKLEKQ